MSQQAVDQYFIAELGQVTISLRQHSNITAAQISQVCSTTCQWLHIPLSLLMSPDSHAVIMVLLLSSKLVWHMRQSLRSSW